MTTSPPPSSSLPSRSLAGLTVATLLGGASLQAAAPIVPTSPPSLTIKVEAGTIKSADGKEIKMKPATLTFDPPTTELYQAREKDGSSPDAPANYDPSYAQMEFWPKALRLSPAKEKNGALMLGNLFRTFREETLKVTNETGTTKYLRDVDFVYLPDWGMIANKDGKMTGKIAASAEANLSRLDLVQAGPDGAPVVKKGTPALLCPYLPAADPGFTALAGVYIAPWKAGHNPFYDQDPAGVRGASEYAITAHEILPIRDTPITAPIHPERIAKTLAKLRAGEPVKIAFLGDSITLGAEARMWWRSDKYSENDLTYRGRVVRALMQRFPKAKIEVIDAFKGGVPIKYGTEQMEAVVAPAKPDLVFIAFGANDVNSPIGGPPTTPVADFAAALTGLAKKTKEFGGEAIFITAFPIQQWNRNGAAHRQPEYNAALMKVADAEGAAVADVYTEYSRLADRGIPPWSQNHNWTNHPGDFGHGVYADAILEFFPGDGKAGAAPKTVAAADAPKPTATAPTAAAPAPSTGPVRKRPDSAAPGPVSTEGAQLTQIAPVAGSWDLTPQPFPPIEQIVAQPAPDRPVYGVYCWDDEYVRYHDFIRAVGWKSLRIGRISDPAIKLTAQDDMEVMAAQGERLQENETDDAFIARYLKKIDALLTRYGPGGTLFKEDPSLPNRPIRFLEVFNEPNFWYMDGKKEFKDAADRITTTARRTELYGKVLVATSKFVKSKWPEVKIVGFGAGGAASADVQFFRDVHAKNPEVAASYDILSTHPYVNSAPEANPIATWGKYSIATNYAKIREIMAQYGNAAKPLWYTELNWEIPYADGGSYPDKPNERGRRNPPDFQAAYLVRAYALALRLGVARLDYMSLVDTDACNSGFINADGSWRPSARAIANMIAIMPRPKLLGALEDGKDNSYVYRFSPDYTKADAPEVIMAWNVAGPKTYDLPIKGESAEVVDMIGTARTVKAIDGKLPLEIGPFPIYVRLPGK